MKTKLSEALVFLNSYGLNARIITNHIDENITIEPSTIYRSTHIRQGKMDGMAMHYEASTGIWEVVEEQAGKNQDKLHIFKETRSLKVALKDLVKGNNRKPIKVW